VIVVVSNVVVSDDLVDAVDSDCNVVVDEMLSISSLHSLARTSAAGCTNPGLQDDVVQLRIRGPKLSWVHAPRQSSEVVIPTSIPLSLR
jgi:hypothetical protein